MKRLSIALSMASLVFSGCFGSETEDKDAPRLVSPVSQVEISPLDTLVLKFDEAVSFSAQQLLADTTILFSTSSQSPKEVRLYGATKFLNVRSMALPMLKPDTTFQIQLSKVKDYAGNVSATQSFELKTLPLGDREFWTEKASNRSLNQADTLIWNDEFTAGTIKGQKYGSQAFAGIIAGAYAEVNHGLDREDYLLVQLSYGDSLNLQLQSKGNLRMTLKGPMQKGTETIPTSNVWTASGDAKSISLGYSATNASHTQIGLTNSDTLGKPLRYWVLIESIKDQQEPIPYILKVNRQKKI